MDMNKICDAFHDATHHEIVLVASTLLGRSLCEQYGLPEAFHKDICIKVYSGIVTGIVQADALAKALTEGERQ